MASSWGTVNGTLRNLGQITGFGRSGGPNAKLKSVLTGALGTYLAYRAARYLYPEINRSRRADSIQRYMPFIGGTLGYILNGYMHDQYKNESMRMGGHKPTMDNGSTTNPALLASGPEPIQKSSAVFSTGGQPPAFNNFGYPGPTFNTFAHTPSTFGKPKQQEEQKPQTLLSAFNPITRVQNAFKGAVLGFIPGMDHLSQKTFGMGASEAYRSIAPYRGVLGNLLGGF